MKAVQIVLDEALLTEIDRAAHKAGASRSAFIREALTGALRALRLRDMIEAEKRAYEGRSETAEERATVRAFAGAQREVLASDEEGENW